MFNILLKLWKKKAITAANIQVAVNRKWISQEQADLIMKETQN